MLAMALLSSGWARQPGRLREGRTGDSGVYGWLRFCSCATEAPYAAATSSRRSSSTFHLVLDAVPLALQLAVACPEARVLVEQPLHIRSAAEEV